MVRIILSLCLVATAPTVSAQPDRNTAVESVLGLLEIEALRSGCGVLSRALPTR